MGEHSNFKSKRCRVRVKNYAMAEPIDAVFTWVNGSDPMFLQSVREHSGLGENHIHLKITGGTTFVLCRKFEGY